MNSFKPYVHICIFSQLYNKSTSRKAVSPLKPHVVFMSALYPHSDLNGKQQ